MSDSRTPRSPDAQAKEDKTFTLALQFAVELGYIIALPAVAFCFGGAYLDKYLKASPSFLLLGIVLALTISTIGVLRKIQEINKSGL